MKRQRQEGGFLIERLDKFGVWVYNGGRKEGVMFILVLVLVLLVSIVTSIFIGYRHHRNQMKFYDEAEEALTQPKR